MASVCYHSFCRRQRLRPPWCWLLVPSGCWMWLGKEWRTTKTIASCTAKVNADPVPPSLEVLKPENCETAPSELESNLILSSFSSYDFLYLCLQQSPVLFFYSIKQTALCHELLSATHSFLNLVHIWVPLPCSTFSVMAGLRKPQVSLAGIIYQEANSLWHVALPVKVYAPGGTAFQPVSWNHSWWEGTLKWNPGKDGILPSSDFWRAGGDRAGGSDGLQSFAFDLLSETST